MLHAQDVRLGGEVALELMKALVASVVAGAQDQAWPAVMALTYSEGILGVYEEFLAVVELGTRADTAAFDQTPLLTAAVALESLATASNGACSSVVRCRHIAVCSSTYTACCLP